MAPTLTARRCDGANPDRLDGAVERSCIGGVPAPTNIALVGCGYVSWMYLEALRNHPQLRLSGVYDRDADRTQKFKQFYAARTYPSLQTLLADDSIDIVVNLTNPRSHAEVSAAAIEAGKHVYSEKPLAWNLEIAEQLAESAVRRGVQLACAPCSILGEAAQTAWSYLRSGALGKVRLAYAELDDGPIYLKNIETWRNAAGVPWPYKDELETGCTLEHAAYLVSWLVAMFGPAASVTSFAAELVPEKAQLFGLEHSAPDFSVGCIEFASGVVARVTNSIVAQPRRRLEIFGENATLSVDDAWDYRSRVLVQGRDQTRYKRLRLQHSPSSHAVGSHRMDFARGIAELAEAIHAGRPCRLSAEFALHVDEICHALANRSRQGARQGSRQGSRQGARQTMRHSCAAMQPMAWAESSKPSLQAAGFESFRDQLDPKYLRSRGRGRDFSVWRGLGETALRVAYSSRWPARVWGQMPGATQAAVVQHDLAVLKPGSPKLRVAFASNLHIGPTTSPRLLENAFQTLASLCPDVLILGGDYVYLDATAERAATLHSLVRRVPARTKIAVLGNHDLWTDHAILEQALSQAGAQVLVNDAVQLAEPHDDVWLLGLDAPRTGAPEPAKLLAKTPEDCTRILVCHSADGFELVPEGIALYLSGRSRAPQSSGARKHLRRSSAEEQHHGALGARVVSRGLGATELPMAGLDRPEVLMLVLSATSEIGA